MLPGGLDDAYRAALTTSHRPYFNISILDGDQNLLEEGITYLSGSVSATLTSRVARTCDLVLDESFYPYLPTDLLAPYGNILEAERGIEFADSSRFSWTVFIGRIQQTELGSDGAVRCFAADFANDIGDVKFLLPENSQTGVTVPTEVRRLISDAKPDATFGAFDSFTQPVQPLTWQLDRAQALDELAQSVGAFWYPLADGHFVLRRYQWTVPGDPVVTYSDGDGGSVIVSSASRARESVYNSLTVTGERLNGDAPVYATAQDTTPSSPTYILGPFGRRHQLMRLQTPSTQAAAQGAAFDNLRRLSALVDSWSWAMTPDASLELGDVVSLDVRDRSGIVQVVAEFHLPLDVSGLMTVSGRSQILGTLEGVV